MSGPDVNTDGIRSHAGHVGSIASGVTEAVDAANSTRIGDHSFGILCAWLAPAFHSMESSATTAFSKVGTNLTYADTALGDMAADYDDHDAQAADLFHSLEAGS